MGGVGYIYSRMGRGAEGWGEAGIKNTGLLLCCWKFAVNQVVDCISCNCMLFYYIYILLSSSLLEEVLLVF